MARRKPQICKVDANQPLIVEELVSLGLTVQSLAKVAKGCPDIVVGVEGMNLLFEIKMPGKGLNEEETRWRQKWRGQVTMVTNSVEVVVEIEHQLMKRGLKLPLKLAGHLVL